MKDKLPILTVPFQKIKDENIEFQLLDMQKLLQVTSIIEYLESPLRLKFNSIMIIEEGEGTHNIDFKEYSYKKGTVFFIAKGQVTSFKLNPNMKCYFIDFTDEFFYRLFHSSVYDIFDYMRYSAFLQLDENDFKALIENINVLKYQLDLEEDEYKESIIQSLFQSLLLQIKRKRVKEVKSLKNTDEVIYRNFLHLVRDSHKYTKRVEDYARKLDISSKTLTRVLNKYTQKTAKTYLDEYLLLSIKRFLLDDSLTLEQISERLEFDMASNLIKFFKRLEGITPLEFKTLHRKK